MFELKRAAVPELRFGSGWRTRRPIGEGAARAAAIVFALLVSAGTVLAYVDSNDAVSPQTQMNGGGCYPRVAQRAADGDAEPAQPRMGRARRGDAPPAPTRTRSRSTARSSSRRSTREAMTRAITTATIRTRSSTSTPPTWGWSPPGTSGRMARRPARSSGSSRSGSTRSSRGRDPATGSPPSAAGSGTAGTRTPIRSARARPR